MVLRVMRDVGKNGASGRIARIREGRLGALSADGDDGSGGAGRTGGDGGPAPDEGDAGADRLVGDLGVPAAPATRFLRRMLPLGATGAAVVLFLLMAVLGASGELTAESLSQAAVNLPADLERLSGLLSRRVADAVADAPLLRSVLPEPGTIDLLGDQNRRWLVENLSQRLGDLSGWVVQGLFVLVTVLFLLIEGEMLAPKVVRIFRAGPWDARAAERTLQELVRQIRTSGGPHGHQPGAGAGAGRGPVAVEGEVRLCPGRDCGGDELRAVCGPASGRAGAGTGDPGPVRVTGRRLIVAAAYTALIGVEANIVTPVVMGRRLDLNGVTVLMACLFWGFLWGLVGLILAVPIAVCMKLIFQHVPSLHRWADLMSLAWQPPPVNPDPLAGPSSRKPPSPRFALPALPVPKPPAVRPLPDPATARRRPDGTCVALTLFGVRCSALVPTASAPFFPPRRTVDGCHARILRHVKL